MHHHRTPFFLTALLAVLLLLTACASSPRVSTPEERAGAMAAIATIETGVVAMRATGKITAAQFELATHQIAEVRFAVSVSADTPVTWTEIYQRVLNLGVAWLPAAPR